MWELKYYFREWNDSTIILDGKQALEKRLTGSQRRAGKIFSPM
jgi:hypothetical protein